MVIGFAILVIKFHKHMHYRCLYFLWFLFRKAVTGGSESERGDDASELRIKKKQIL